MKRSNEEQTNGKKKRVRPKAGMILAIPLLDGTFCLAHVAKYYISVTVVLFAHRRQSIEDLQDGLEDAMNRKSMAVMECPSTDIVHGTWVVIGHREPAYPPEMLDTKGRSYTSPVITSLFEAVYGLRPWDEMAVPRWYDRMLLPHLPSPPPMARMKADFQKAITAPESTVPTAGESQETPITEGPGEIHIEIKYEGEGLPTIPLLKRRQTIEDAITNAGVGDITDAGGGGGVMDIYVETQDVARALPVVRAAIQDANFEECARMEVNPLEEEGESEDTEDATNEDDAR